MDMDSNKCTIYLHAATLFLLSIPSFPPAVDMALRVTSLALVSWSVATSGKVPRGESDGPKCSCLLVQIDHSIN